MSPPSVLLSLGCLVGYAAALQGYKNVLGGELQPCSQPGMALTGFTRNGHCIDRDDDRGSHHICIDLSSTDGGNFCSVTGQSNWCSSEMPCVSGGGRCPVQQWCVCQWAFASYLQRAGGCDKIQDIVCEAVNEEALKAYQRSPDHTEALNCLKSRCNLNAAAAKLPAASTREGEGEKSVLPDAEPLPTTPQPPAMSQPLPTTVSVGLGHSAVPIPASDKAAAPKPLPHAEGESEEGGSGGAMLGALAGAMACLAATGGVAYVAMRRSSTAMPQEQELEQPLPQAEATTSDALPTPTEE
eukprot:Hpha_TRINITY_DN13209_c0_g2::TRINITY_DN13209_c0_g2_i1::g.154780::m.154780